MAHLTSDAVPRTVSTPSLAPGRPDRAARRRRRGLRGLAAATVVFLAACTGTEAPPESDQVSAPSSAAPDPGQGGYPFGPSSVWRLDVTTAPVAPDSAPKVQYLAGTVADRYGGVAAFNVWQYNNAYYVAAPDTPRVDVAFDDCQDKGYLPDGLTGPGGQFTDVPIPEGAVPANGTDRMLSVYAPDTDQLWEFWIAQQDGEGRWSACWGGRIDEVSTSAGYFPDGFGASASGLATTAGMVRLDEVREGRIGHALSLAIPNPAVYTELSWPAQRSDGWDTHPDAMPEGSRLRLDPAVDVDALGLTPLAAMIARAAQTYGFIVTDKSGAVAVATESGAAEQARTGVDPWVEILGSTPDYLVMQGFPWDRLQLLPRDYGRPAG